VNGVRLVPLLRARAKGDVHPLRKSAHAEKFGRSAAALSGGNRDDLFPSTENFGTKAVQRGQAPIFSSANSRHRFKRKERKKAKSQYADKSTLPGTSSLRLLIRAGYGKDAFFFGHRTSRTKRFLEWRLKPIPVRKGRFASKSRSRGRL